MATISLCMIVKNEEKVLARCLNSCKNIFDEIIIVDTGSTDNTKNIAKKYTTKVFDFKWQNDFSLARNYSFKKASGEYIMWLDADDIIPKTTKKEILKIKGLLTSDVYMLKYDISQKGNCGAFSFYRERIVKNCKNALWHGAVHECIVPFGKIEYINFSILHLKDSNQKSSNRNINIYKNILKQRELSPREQYYYARELYDHKKFQKSASILKKFITSGKGWIENVLDAIFLLSNCYAILGKEELQKEILLSSFKYGIPRANIMCKLADIFLKNKNYETAIYWYKLATSSEDVSKQGGFVESIYYNYYPYLQLCYCYFCLNDNITANKFNKLAKKYVKSAEVLSNERFFENILKK